MATKQASKDTSSGSAARKPGQSSPPSGAVRQPSGTSERDEHYDLISVLYHSLQGAETCGQYIRDAQDSGDDELVDFLEDTRAEYAARAQQAKQMLVDRMEEEEEEGEEEDESED